MPMLDVERRGRVVVVRIDHPPHNFMTAGMVRELQRLVRSLDGDRSVGAVVITGKPDDLYITHYDVGEILASVRRAGIAAPPWLTAVILRVAGAVRHVPVLRELAERTPLAAVFELYRVHDLFLEMNRSDKVFIAAINGPATGGGCEISLACDIRVMADADIAIGLPEMTIDFNPGAGGTQRLPRLVGVGRALQMMLDGRTLSPREALDHGLIGAVVPADQVKEAAIHMGERLARRSPEAIRSLKRAVYEGASPAPRRGTRGGAQVVHGRLSDRLLPGEDGRDGQAGGGGGALAVGERRGPRPLAGRIRRRLVPPGGRRPLRDPADHRPDDARRLRQLPRLEAVDPEARVGDQLAGWAVGMTPRREEPPGALEPVLPPGGPGMAASHMLEEEELSSLDQDPAGLRERTLRVRDRAEHERRDDRVEAVVVERQVLGRCLHDLGVTGRARLPGDPLAQAAGHVGVGLGQDQFGDGAGVVLEVAARARAELENPARRRRQQLAPHLSQPRALGRGAHPVVEASEDRVLTHAEIISTGPDAQRPAGRRPEARDCKLRRKVKERGSTGQVTRRGETMPTFVMLTNLTSEGVQTLKNNPSRVQEVNKEVEQLGVTVKEQWATLGQYDFITIVEAPDEKTMAKVSVELGSRGTMSSQTLAAIPVDDFAKSL